MAAVADTIEGSDAVVITGNGLAVDDAGARAEARQGLDDEREAIGEIVARTAIKPHLRALLPGNDAEAIVFDLMQPSASRWQLIGFGGETRRDEPDWEGTLQHSADS